MSLDSGSYVFSLVPGQMVVILTASHEKYSNKSKISLLPLGFSLLSCDLSSNDQMKEILALVCGTRKQEI